MTSNATNSYVWDARNQLISMNLGSSAFQYGAFGAVAHQQEPPREVLRDGLPLVIFTKSANRLLLPRPSPLVRSAVGEL